MSNEAILDLRISQKWQEDLYLLRYIAVQSGESQPSFWLDLPFKPEDGGDMILRNVG
jgi:hypothetical protein